VPTLSIVYKKNVTCKICSTKNKDLHMFLFLGCFKVSGSEDPNVLIQLFSDVDLTSVFTSYIKFCFPYLTVIMLDLIANYELRHGNLR
jgi:hypothetical protein